MDARSNTTSARSRPPRSVASVQRRSARGLRFRRSREQLACRACTIELLDKTATLLATTLTDANGEYAFTALPAGDYQVHEHPADRILRRRRARRHGGRRSLDGVDYDSSRYSTCRPASTRIQYDFCEHIGVNAFGQRLSRPQQRRHFRSRPGEEGIGGVRLEADRRRRQRYRPAGHHQRHRLLQIHESGRRQVHGDGSSAVAVGSTAKTRRATWAASPPFRRRAT